MFTLVVFMALLPLNCLNPIHSLEKRDEMEDIFFSDNWRDLYYYYNKTCSEFTKKTIIKWEKDCIYVCDDAGLPLFLDRRRNQFDIGLGSIQLKYGPGATRSPKDNNLYSNDPCPEGISENSLISIERISDRDDPYVIICNEERRTEFLSLRFSHCPNGVDYHKPSPKPPSMRVEGGSCLIQYHNRTIVNLRHDEFKSEPLNMNRLGDYDLCMYSYCCDAIHRMFTGSCGITDHCNRLAG